MFGASLQGYWLVASIYIVVEVGLTPLQLLLLGTTLEVTVLVAEVPTGVVADSSSRKWSMVLSMVIMAAAFTVAASAGSFEALVISNVLWGIGYTFTSGADVAWITDELMHRGDTGSTVDQALTAKARWQQRGGAVGLVAFGLLAWWTTLATAMVSAAALLVIQALWITMVFAEDRFERHRQRGPRAALAQSRRILKAGTSLIRADRVIVNMLAVTVLFNLGAEAMDRLTEIRLIELGLPGDASPILFFTGLGIIGLLAGAALLRAVEPRIEGEDGPRTVYGAMSLVAAAGAMVVAVAPTAMIGALGVFLARGLAWSVLPVVSSVWINRSTGSETRATVQSFLGQATSAGQILSGLMLGAIAVALGLAAAIGLSSLLFAVSGLLILRTGKRGERPGLPAAGVG